MNLANTYTTTPLLEAVAQKETAIISTLLNNGADPTYENSRGDNALHKAVTTGNLEVVELILSK